MNIETVIAELNNLKANMDNIDSIQTRSKYNYIMNTLFSTTNIDYFSKVSQALINNN